MQQSSACANHAKSKHATCKGALGRGPAVRSHPEKKCLFAPARRGRRPTVGSHISNAQQGNGIGGKWSWNETRVLRTMLGREKQGF